MERGSSPGLLSMSETTLKGLKTSHQIITPGCRARLGDDAALEFAFGRIREAYRSIVGYGSNKEVLWDVVLIRREVEE